MKNFKYILVSFLMGAVLIPQLAFASWWNPLSWFHNWTFHETKVEQTFVISNESSQTAQEKPPVEKSNKESKSARVEENSNVQVDTKNCSDVYNPVCGEDNKTYTNFCSLGEGIKFKHNGVCVNSEVDQKSSPATNLIPPPTAKQVAGLTNLCADATSQGQLIETCGSGTLWNNYYSDEVFRNKVDVLIAQYDAIKATQTSVALKQSQQASCDYTKNSSLQSQMTPWAGTLAIKEACGTATDGDRINYGMSELQHQLSGLKDTISKNQAEALRRTDLERLQQQNSNLMNSYSNSNNWKVIFENDGGRVYNSTGQSYTFVCDSNVCRTF